MDICALLTPHCLSSVDSGEVASDVRVALTVRTNIMIHDVSKILVVFIFIGFLVVFAVFTAFLYSLITRKSAPCTNTFSILAGAGAVPGEIAGWFKPT